MKYLFRPSAEKQFGKLDSQIQTRIIKKMEFIISTLNPLDWAEPLTQSKIGQYRFRIGDYRVIFDVEDDTIVVLTFGHRREIYK